MASDTAVHRNRIAYLDYAAGGPPDRRILKVLCTAAFRCYGHASSAHVRGRASQHAKQAASSELLSLLGLEDSARVVWGSCGTEANNLVTLGLPWVKGSRIITSAVEHPSISMPLLHLREREVELDILPVDSGGRVCVEQLRRSLDRGRAQLVTIQFANQETGVLQPVEDIAATCRDFGAPFHCDVIQAVGKTPFSPTLGMTAFSLSGYKFHGPRGNGALILRESHPALSPLIFGSGEQEFGLRAGTQPVELILATAHALRIALQELDRESARVAGLRDRFEQQLLDSLGPERVRFNGSSGHRLPGFSNVSILGLDAQAGWLFVEHLQRRGLCVSRGSACQSSLVEHPSPTLTAMGVPYNEAKSSFRVSLGRFSTDEDVDTAVTVIVRAFQRIRRTCVSSPG